MESKKSLLITGVSVLLIVLLCVCPTASASSTTDSSTATASSTQTSTTTPSATSASQGGSTNAGSTNSPTTTTTTTMATTMPTYYTCREGVCNATSCSSVATECNTTGYCKIEKVSENSYNLTCSSTSCNTNADQHCCQENHCNDDITDLRSSTGHMNTYPAVLIFVSVLAAMVATEQRT